MKVRLRFWLAMLDVVACLRVVFWLYLWIVGRASDATDWGEGAKCGDGNPF